MKEYKKQWRIKNKERERIKAHDYYLKNKERIDKRQAKYTKNNKHIRKKWRIKNKEYIRNKNKEWKENNTEYLEKYNKKYMSNYREKNKEKRRKYNHLWNKNNHDKINLRYKRRKTDIQYMLTKILRQRTYKACKLQRTIKKFKYDEYIGCTPNKLISHLEKQFKPGMSWKNHGKWHIHHIKWCETFDLTKPEEQKKCFHYTNLMPVWAEEHHRIHKENKAL